MKVSVRSAGAIHGAPNIHLRSGGVTHAVSRAWVRSGGALVQFFTTLAVTLSSYTAIGRANSASVITVTSDPVTATPSGTIGAVSYAWSRTAPDAQPWTINSPNSPTTTFSTDCDQGQKFDATFICTITDAAGRVLASSPVAVDCANIYYGGGFLGSGGTPGLPYP